MKSDSYSLTAHEVALFIENKIRRFQENPLINIDNLTHIGMVLTALGLVKDNNILKMLGDLLTEAPDRLKPLITLKYTLVGTIGELQVTLNKLAENTVRELIEIVYEIARTITAPASPERENKLVELTGKLYDLLVIRLPSISIAAGVTETE